MTFEEWKEKHSDLIENVAITFFNYERGVDTKTCYDELEYLLRRAFRAGKDMDVSTTKWHKVADGDLPKEEAEYLVIFESDGTKYIGIESYYPDTKEWSTVCKIVAWCEIPRIEDEAP